VPARTADAQQPLYLQIVAHAAGNGLALALGAVLLGLWRLLADVREPALWAAVTSVVLRDLKDALVHGGVSLLQSRRVPAIRTCPALHRSAGLPAAAATLVPRSPPHHAEALGRARSSLPRLCASLALAPLRLLTDPAVAAVQACAAWRGYMAQTAAQVRPDCERLPQEHGVSVRSACGLFSSARRAHSFLANAA